MEIGKTSECTFKERDRSAIHTLQSAARGSKHRESEVRLPHPSYPEVVTNLGDDHTHLGGVRETLTEKQLYKPCLEGEKGKKKREKAMKQHQERQPEGLLLQDKRKFQRGQQFQGGELQGEAVRRGTRKAQLREREHKSLPTSMPDWKSQGVQRWVPRAQARRQKNPAWNREPAINTREELKQGGQELFNRSWREVCEPSQKEIAQTPDTCLPYQVDHCWRELQRSPEKVYPGRYGESSEQVDVSSEQEEMQIDPSEQDSLLPEFPMDCTLCLAGSMESLTEE